LTIDEENRYCMTWREVQHRGGVHEHGIVINTLMMVSLQAPKFGLNVELKTKFRSLHSGIDGCCDGVNNVPLFRQTEVHEFFTGLVEENLDVLKREVLDLIVCGIRLLKSVSKR
jgi:hypothetical protein